MNKDRASVNSEEITRLVSLGLGVTTAMDVANGVRDECFEVRRAQERAEVNNFYNNMSQIPKDLEPAWDLCRERFYLAFDGYAPNDGRMRKLELIEVDIAEVSKLLTCNASRIEHPWHEKYKRKSCGVVYRWLLALGVTPPVIRTFQNKIQIDGGMHRFHLAMHYKSKRMPFLIWSCDRNAIFSMLSSAKAVPQ